MIFTAVTLFISNEVKLSRSRAVNTIVHVAHCTVSVSFYQILELLIPEEEADLSDLVLEVTAGVGGQEAMLFTAEVWSCVLS